MCPPDLGEPARLGVRVYFNASCDSWETDVLDTYSHSDTYSHPVLDIRSIASRTNRETGERESESEMLA